jgi:mannose-1-phosphate guanylyltransferase
MKPMGKNTYVVIMAGGYGTRLWPLSRRSRPKHLLSLLKGGTLLQETVDLVEGFVDKEHLFIATVQGQLKEIETQLRGLSKENFILEPFGRGTAACIGLAATLISQKSPDGVMVVLTADHVIGPKRRFLTALREAVKMATTERRLFTFGVKPGEASTSYGYVERGRAVEGRGVKVWEVKSFKEKPDAKRAKTFIKSGRYFWNSGMFVWRADVILEELKRFLPHLSRTLCKIRPSLGTFWGDSAFAKAYGFLPTVSIDHGVLEKAKNVRVIEAGFEWSDIGNWLALERFHRANTEGNAIIGTHCGLDTSDCLIVGKDDCLIATIGVKDLVIVHTEDATLVCDKSRVEDIKALIKRLGEGKLRQYL